MAEILTEWPKTAAGGRPKGSGCYAVFLDGQIYRIVAGTDVPSTKYSSVQQGFYAAARRSGRRVRCWCESRDPLIFIVQAVPKDGK